LAPLVRLAIVAACWGALVPAGTGPQRAAGGDWQSQWAAAHDPDGTIVHYFDRRMRELAGALRKQYSPGQFVRQSETVRRALRATYLMPGTRENGRSRLVHETSIDGLAVEVRVLPILPGLYSVLRIYRPGGGQRHPAMLFLPGHGDPAWHPNVQKRLLGFAKQGYVAATSDPFGQGELADVPAWAEYHGCGSMAYLLTAGQSLLGVIMASHTVELSYLCSRQDVNPDQLVVMGGSMGGTHALWLGAIDTRIKGVCAVSAAPALDPSWNLRHHCLCDSMVGACRVADGEIVRSLVAPRPLLVIYPDLEAPVTDQGAMLINEGKLDFMDKAAKSRYFLNDREMAEIYPFARAVYRRENAADRFREVVMVGPHGDARQYRELAYGWFARFLQGAATAASQAEAPLTPLGDIALAKAVLSAWPDGKRPDDFLGPTAYTQRAISALADELPEPPSTATAARRLGDRLRQDVGRLLGISRPRPAARFSQDGPLEIDGVPAAKYTVESEPGVRIPILVFKPAGGGRGTLSKTRASLCVLLDPQGVTATAGSADRKRLLDQGSWVVCADLRGMGSMYSRLAAYVGVRDQCLCVGALKLGETVAGWWTGDLLAVVEAARSVVAGPVSVTVKAKRETGLIAILAAGQSLSINAVETEELLASYRSAPGSLPAYGFPYVYGGAGGHNADLHVYGSMVPCVPRMLEVADIPQLAAMVCPRPLRIADPLWANGTRVSAEDVPGVFAWTGRFYKASGCGAALVLQR
jgi:pimeloyl-ACP methyl ester carboxylesterase